MNSTEPQKESVGEFDIAIVGMAGRFPGARNVEEFWENIRDGIDSVTKFTDEQLESAGIPHSVYNDPSYVKAAPVLEDAGHFDARFFGISPKEATATDPQQRQFLQCAWEALENAGIDVHRLTDVVGVFGGSAMNTYLLNTELTNEFRENYLPTLIGNDNSFLTTRVSYKLNLSGPSVTVQTACSTSLVAVHMGCQSILAGECDIALSGGVSVRVPQIAGHKYVQNSVFTPDGLCKPFDSSANGTIFGSGVGIVVLKKLSDAILNNDTIHAVIKGTAINNDGSSKADYTAPSVDSQSEVIREALDCAGVESKSVTLVEAHGTGTYLGDPIEVSALTKAFANDTDETGYCAIGSVKSNIGHLDAAAGIAGLIKCVMALKHKTLPSTINFRNPNPTIDFSQTPFYVNTQSTDWNSEMSPRRACISALGIGGTNAHAVLEEAPTVKEAPELGNVQLIVQSAKSELALNDYSALLADYLAEGRAENIENVCHTLRYSRAEFQHRRVAVCRGIETAITVLRDPVSKLNESSSETLDRPEIVFMYPGAGSPHPKMGVELYRTEPIYKKHVDRCLAILEKISRIDYSEILFGPDVGSDSSPIEYARPSIGYPPLFITEYALSQLWISRGVKPSALIGHSVGDYVAATVSGVFTLEDALLLVVERARLFDSLPNGAMLNVSLNEEECQQYLVGDLSMAVINGPKSCVLSGLVSEVEQAEKLLAKDSHDYQRVKMSIAAHSQLIDGIVDEFQEIVSKCTLSAPKIPLISNLHGKWADTEEIQHAEYWAKHLRNTVRFADGIGVLQNEKQRVFIEVGPGGTLSSLTRRHTSFDNSRHRIVQSLPHALDDTPDNAFNLLAFGKLWQAGIDVDWTSLDVSQNRRTVPLPTYPFQRENFWYSAYRADQFLTRKTSSIAKLTDKNDWLYSSYWQRKVNPSNVSDAGSANAAEEILIFANNQAICGQIISRLNALDCRVFTVRYGEEFTFNSNLREATIRRVMSEDYLSLFKQLSKHEIKLENILHAWSIDNQSLTDLPNLEALSDNLENGYYSVLFLCQGIANAGLNNRINLKILTRQMHDVLGNRAIDPGAAAMHGPIRVIGQEYPNIRCVGIDLCDEELFSKDVSHLVREITNELLNKENKVRFVALRNQCRWIQEFSNIRLPGSSTEIVESNSLDNGGVYLITGGFGEIGAILAQHIAETFDRPVINLMGRSLLPDKRDWPGVTLENGYDETLVKKISNLRELEKSGAVVNVYMGDCSDEDRLSAIIVDIENNNGRLNGVVHAAGIITSDNFKTIESASRIESELHFKSKIYSLMAMSNVLKDKKLDFCICMSSIASVLGGVGHAAYTAANASMDAYVYMHNRQYSMNWISVGWDIWRYEGLEDSVGDLAESTVANLGLTPDEGLKLFSKVTQLSNISHIIVSTGKLSERIDTWSGLDEANDLNLNKASKPSMTEIADDKAMSLTPTQTQVAEIWISHLGITKLDIRESFTSLGGHSLLATQIISDMRSTFSVALTIKDIFTNDTVEKLSDAIDLKINEASEIGNETFNDLLSKVNSLSDEEIRKQLEN